VYPDKLPRNQLYNILSPFLYKWSERLPGLVLDHASSALAPAWKSIPHRLRQKHYLPFSVIAASQSHVTLPPYGYSSLSKVSVTFRHSSQGLSKPGDSCHIKSIPMWWRRQVWGATRAFPGRLRPSLPALGFPLVTARGERSQILSKMSSLIRACRNRRPRRDYLGTHAWHDVGY